MHLLRLNSKPFIAFVIVLVFIFSGLIAYAGESEELSWPQTIASLQDELLTKVISRLSGRVLAVPATNTSQGIAGLWNPKSRTILIFLNEKATYESYKEVLRHEAVHMAQYCNGLNQRSALPLPIGAIIGDTAIANFASGRQKGLYNEFQKILEAEAYTMESGSDQDVITLLEMLCKDLNR